MVWQILSSVVVAATAFLTALLQHKKPWSDKRTRRYRWGFRGCLVLFMFALGLSIYLAVRADQTSSEQNAQLTTMDGTLKSIQDVVGGNSQAAVLEAVKQQNVDLGAIRTTLSSVAEIVGVQDPAGVLAAVKEQKSQLATIQTTLDGIASAVGVHDHAALLAAVIDLKESVANTRHSLDLTNHRVGDLDNKVSGVAADIAPRTFDERALLGALAASPKKGAVEVNCILGNGESCQLAQRLDDVLKRAGWSTADVSQSVFSGVPVGVLIRVHSKEHVPDHAGPLQHALLAGGLGAEGAVAAEVPDGAIQLLVGNKP